VYAESSVSLTEFVYCPIKASQICTSVKRSFLQIEVYQKNMALAIHYKNIFNIQFSFSFQTKAKKCLQLRQVCGNISWRV